MKKLKIILVGMGVAGRSRQRAVLLSEHFELAGMVSRHLSLESRNWEEVLSDRSIEAVAISTENSSHSRLVRQALEADKHVLCDYPLAFSGTEAESLFALADSKNKILHVEQIALLTATHQFFKSQIFPLGELKQGSFIFTAGWNPKFLESEKWGAFPFLTESRLVQLADLFGFFEIKKSKWFANETEAFIQLQLQFEKGGNLLFEEKRAFGLQRKRTFSADFENGVGHWPEIKEEKGLFRKDLENFFGRIVLGEKAYYQQKYIPDILSKLSCVSESLQDSFF